MVSHASIFAVIWDEPDISSTGILSRLLSLLCSLRLEHSYLTQCVLHRLHLEIKKLTRSELLRSENNFKFDPVTRARLLEIFFLLLSASFRLFHRSSSQTGSLSGFNRFGLVGIRSQ